MKIIFSGDKYAMNWLRPDFDYAETECPEGLISRVETEREGDITRTAVHITNPTHKPIFTTRQGICIKLPLQDRYEKTDLCLTSRAHVHLFCGGHVSWAMALRMGGDAPHLGFALTSGSLDSYSILHNGPLANDRGCFVLHPSADVWKPGETKTFSWVIFPHQGKEDFFRQLPQFCRYIHVEASRYVLFNGESTVLTIRPCFAAKHVQVDGQLLEGKNGLYTLVWTPETIGEHVFRIEVDGIKTWCRVLTTLSADQLAYNRVRFLRDHQQYHGELSCVEGAYLAYDNDDEQLVLTPFNDFNGGRERVCMGVLMARYLSAGGSDPDGSLRRSLDAYTAYILRELVDEETGRVFNDLCRDDSFKRTYNFSWFVRYFLEQYYLSGDKADLQRAWKIIMCYYEHENGARFYPIELPIADLHAALTEAGMLEEQGALLPWELRHAENLMAVGVHYPPSEVAFEQSIIGPAADVLLQVYEITGEQKYLEGARVHLRLLELFNGCQPDYHRYEVAIRNWDGYWFGKWMIFGDTFPHYWSSITGNCFSRYARLTGDTGYADRAEKSLRGVLPMIFPDGRASCAYVYPVTSNGVRGECYDPRANDQDWGLYFYLREHHRD